MQKNETIKPETVGIEQEVQPSPTVSKEERKNPPDAEDAAKEKAPQSDYEERSYAYPDFGKDDKK